jgi:hypothetical protein
MGAAEETEEERHDGIGDLLGAVAVDVDEAEAELGGRGGVGGAVGGAEAEQELPGAESALRNAREEGKRGEQHGGGGLDAAGREDGERRVLHGRRARQRLPLHRRVLDAVERHHQRLPRAAGGGDWAGLCSISLCRVGAQTAAAFVRPGTCPSRCAKLF